MQDLNLKNMIILSLGSNLNSKHGNRFENLELAINLLESYGILLNKKSSFYKSGKKLIIRAKKLEKKEKIEKAKTLYLKALEKLEKAYDKDKKNADILYYLGFALRKTGVFEKAENFYLEGL